MNSKNVLRSISAAGTALICSIAFAYAAKGATPDAELIHGTMAVTAIHDRFWTQSVEQDLRARGEYLMEVKFLSPAKYAGAQRQLGIISLREMKVDGVLVQAGDILEFDATEERYVGTVVPYLFRDFKNVHRLKRSKSKP